MIDTSLVNVESLNDSIAKVIPIIQAIKENSAPAPFTYINIIISLFAAIFGLGSFYFAKKTADNVSRLSKDTQIMLCEDLIKDMFQQVVRLLVIWRRVNNKECVTEKYIKDLKYWPSDIYFKQDVYNSKSRIYKKIYNLKLRMRDYTDKVNSCQEKFNSKNTIKQSDIKELYAGNWRNLYEVYRIYQDINKKCRQNSPNEFFKSFYEKFHQEYHATLQKKKYYKDIPEDENLIAELVNKYDVDVQEADSEDPLNEIKDTLKSIICGDASIYESCLRIHEKKEREKESPQ